MNIDENQIKIKKYDSSDNKLLNELCLRNPCVSRGFSTEMLLEGALMKYGLPKIALFLCFTFALGYYPLRSKGYQPWTAGLASAVTQFFFLAFLYGFIFPKVTAKQEQEFQLGSALQQLSSIRNVLPNPEKGCWIAQCQAYINDVPEKVIGCMMVEPYNTIKDSAEIMQGIEDHGKIAQCWRLTEISFRRRKEVELQLLLEAIEYCKNRGYKTLVLELLRSDSATILLYRIAGFEIRKKICYRSSLIPFTVIVMTMKL